jgi:chorismate mutase/prephenate dehydratase
MIDSSKNAEALLPDTAVVACQGVEGAYSQEAANSLFKQPDILYMSTFDGVFRAVDSGICQYGILPIENSNTGSVADVYDLMKKHAFCIVRSIEIPVSHALLSREKISVKDIKDIYTHEQVIKQCSEFLKKNSHIRANACANTAKAAQLIAQDERGDIAVVASEKCAKIYGLVVLAKHIQNSSSNFTKFICISKTSDAAA